MHKMPTIENISETTLKSGHVFMLKDYISLYIIKKEKRKSCTLILKLYFEFVY